MPGDMVVLLCSWRPPGAGWTLTGQAWWRIQPEPQMVDDHVIVLRGQAEAPVHRAAREMGAAPAPSVDGLEPSNGAASGGGAADTHPRVGR